MAYWIMVQQIMVQPIKVQVLGGLVITFGQHVFYRGLPTAHMRLSWRLRMRLT